MKHKDSVWIFSFFLLLGAAILLFSLAKIIVTVPSSLSFSDRGGMRGILLR
jgi:hypothetical protein